MAEGLAKTQQYTAQFSGDLYLRIHQDDSIAEAGSITFGADHEEVHAESEWAVNVPGLEYGYIVRDGYGGKA